MAGAPARLPALLAPSPRLLEEMAGPLDRGTGTLFGAAAVERCAPAQAGVPLGCARTPAAVLKGQLPVVEPGGAPQGFSALDSVCGAGGHWLRCLCARGSAPRFRQALGDAGRREGAAVVGPGRWGWQVGARRGEASEVRRGAAAAATLLPPGLLPGSLARLLARAVRVQPAALRTRANGARSRTRPRREAPRWVLKSPDSAPPPSLSRSWASLNPGAGGALPARLLQLPGTRQGFTFPEGKATRWAMGEGSGRRLGQPPQVRLR